MTMRSQTTEARPTAATLRESARQYQRAFEAFEALDAECRARPIGTKLPDHWTTLRENVRDRQSQLVAEMRAADVRAVTCNGRLYMDCSTDVTPELRYPIDTDDGGPPEVIVISVPLGSVKRLD